MIIKGEPARPRSPHRKTYRVSDSSEQTGETATAHVSPGAGQSAERAKPEPERHAHRTGALEEGAGDTAGRASPASAPRQNRFGPRPGEPLPAYAALDLGTNNCRLLIATPTPGGFRVIDSFSRIVRLGEGVGGSGALSEEAMDRAVGALKVCAAKLSDRKVRKARLIAT
ncbi:MAG: exopolyphosphatase, partial [Hyphomicrobiaceae bacterium]|nr:exopolyphosphatase [Hyphomicrobiaceae bacterium]